MLTPDLLKSEQSKVSKNVHKSVQSRPATPQGAVLLDILKTLELRLQDKAILAGSPDSPFNPLWFLAETERNIYLWRQGRSLEEQCEYEFWIDLRALISKRLQQLQSTDTENPFLNPLWGTTAEDENTAKQETDYLLSFLEALKKIEVHACAISQVGSILFSETPSVQAREVVILPEA